MKDYSDLITLLRMEDGGGVIDYDSVMEEAADAIEDLSEQVKPCMLEGTDYKVKQALWVGNREVIMAERPKYGEGDKFYDPQPRQIIIVEKRPTKGVFDP